MLLFVLFLVIDMWCLDQTIAITSKKFDAILLFHLLLLITSYSDIYLCWLLLPHLKLSNLTFLIFFQDIFSLSFISCFLLSILLYIHLVFPFYFILFSYLSLIFIPKFFVTVIISISLPIPSYLTYSLTPSLLPSLSFTLPPSFPPSLLPSLPLSHPHSPSLPLPPLLSVWLSDSVPAYGGCLRGSLVQERG